MANRNDLNKQAEELGLTVDGRWSDARLQQEIDTALAADPKHADPTKPIPNQAGSQIVPTGSAEVEIIPPTEIGMNKTERKIPVKLLYDTWLEADVRTEAGNVVDLPLSKAKELIAAGKAERADKFPGE